MTNDLWNDVDRYINRLLVRQDSALQDALKASEQAGLPDIQVSPAQGKMWHLLARSIHARNILELGTLGGYSTIWLARALPANGHMITLESNPRHIEVARSNLVRAGLQDLVEVRPGLALDTLPQLAAESRGPFDLIFIDADKPGYPDYLPWALKLSRPGTLILADNVIRKGSVIDAACSDERVQGVRRFLDLAAAEPRLSATAMQTVGSKGYDGFLLALVMGGDERRTETGEVLNANPNAGRSSR